MAIAGLVLQPEPLSAIRLTSALDPELVAEVLAVIQSWPRRA